MLTPENTSADHDIPLSRGGEHGMGNIHLVTSRVNYSKHDMTTAEFVALCRDVVAWADRNA